ncbi:hypothetical protein IPC1147_33060 [Pseudomonas aeruginosa]|nr:hypothetical protein IPC353_32075 [Pseudomonas aeruginosa]RRS16699.1 hypothetical protein IPC1107_32995 [Pseudomonas aeruginosa]RRS18261.1 hypothetical protein IPC1147_33060 [Pseudomonas aeruginosa]
MRVGLGYHGVAIAAVFGVVGILQLLVGRLSGAILVLLGLCAYFATSEATALRQGVLDGDMRIGCFSYQSLECRRMLNLNEAGSVTMYKNPNELSLGGYADWYLPVLAHAQAKVQSNYPNAVPGVSFLRSPFVLLRIGEMNTQIRVQRDEVSLERARLGTQGPEASDRT